MAVKEPRIKNNKLNILDFSLGIRAEEINDNFDLIRYWIEMERLRTGGWGLVEGFELTRNLADFTIHVDKGVLINEHGEEVKVDEHTFHVGPPKYDEVVDTVTSDSEGVLSLTYPVYSNDEHHVVYYIAGNDIFFENEIKIIDVDTGRELTVAGDVEWIAETKIKLTQRWADREIRVEYFYAADRIDAVLVKKDGSEYKDPMPMGIISTSPSQQVIQDYFEQGWYLIGFAYWHVGQEVDVEFFTGDRTLRKVFVDRNNVLYLNGKPYQEKTVIYFVRPEPPQENDLWYDTQTEILYIWRPNEDGVYEWQPVNDLARGITEVYQFAEDENPDDLRTFDFTEHPKLFFIPGKHQLTVIVDQVVIMEDQYEELYYDQETVEQIKQQLLTNSADTVITEALNQAAAQISSLVSSNYYKNVLTDLVRETKDRLYTNLQKNLCGYGIRFKYPLERPSLVEIRVKHDLNTRKHDDTDLFQTEAIFLASGNQKVTSASQTVYETGCEYESGMSQLEVYKNGLRLVKDVDYKEVLKNGSVATDPGQICNKFKLLRAPITNDMLDFRVLRQMSSYANLKAALREFETQVEACQTQITEAISRFTSAESDLRSTVENHTGVIAEHSAAITALQNDKMSSSARIGKTNLDSSIYSGVIAGKIEMVKQANALSIFLSNVKNTDYVQISYVLRDDNPILLSAQAGDYVLENTTGGCNLRLNGRWLNDAAAKLYITGLRIGV